MGKAGSILAGLGVTGLGILWFYGIMYLWLWEGLVHAGSNGWIAGYAILFIIFLIISIIVIIFLGLGYVLAISLWDD